MGTIEQFKMENLIIGVLSTLPGAENEIKTVLEKEFGPIDLVSEQMDFNFTNYYDGEMGAGIRRWFYSFDVLVDPAELSRIKILTNDLEERWSIDGKRRVNLDPGILDLNRLILATTKNVGHRIPLNDGIYGEVTLIYMKKDFHSLPWTYPDYSSSEYIAVLKDIRKLYRDKLKRQ